ncbi:MAG: guanylate kinase [Bacteroidales bacterium]
MKGKLIIVSAPSGAGKTSVVKYLLEYQTHLSFSISATSRSKRENEKDKKDYYFLSVEEFKQKIAQNEFLEWEEVYPNQFYGTLKSEVYRIWNEGQHVIFDVDVKGGLNIKQQFGDQALAVFVKPPTIRELEKRLLYRGTETPETLKKRLDKASYELSFADQFDVIVVNEDLKIAQKEMVRVVDDFLRVY